MTLFLMDADCFIESSKTHYPMEEEPDVWLFLEEQARAGTIISVKRVDEEILEGDAVAEWKDRRLPSTFFKSVDCDDCLTSLGKISDWFDARAHYKPSARNAFLERADSHLVTYAMAHGAVVVTLEKRNPLSISRVKIPDVCDAMGVEVISLNDMFVRLNAPFIERLGLT